MKNPTWLSALALALAFSACAPTVRFDARATFRDSLDSLPAAWKAEPIVALTDSIHLIFRAAADAREGNRVERRQVTWFVVNRRNPNVLEHIYRPDFENLEGPVALSASAWFPDGTKWTLPPGGAFRQRSSEGEYPSTNRFISGFSLPRYPEGTLIRLEEVRDYNRPEFLKTELLRGDYPCLAKRIAVSMPPGADFRLGMSNPEGLAFDTSRTADPAGSSFVVSAARLAKLDGRTMPREPEAWFAALQFSLPPRGLRAYAWKELGDHYLATIKASTSPTPAIAKLAETVHDKEPDSVAAHVLTLLRARLRYHADMDKLHAYVPRSAAEVLAKGYGDCKEMSTLMAVLLKLKGVRAGMALVSPPGYLQVVPEYPTLGGFNHMVVWVDVPGKPLRFFDPTVNYGDPNDSYFPILERRALVLDSGNSRLVKVEAGKGFRNQVETRSSIVREGAGPDWRLQGNIKLEGLCAFQLFPVLESVKGDENIPFLKEYLKDVFGVQASSCKAASHPDRTSISIEYQASFTANYLDLDKGGLLVNQPSLFGGEARYTTLDFEGPRHYSQVEQNDLWQVPAGFGEIKADPLDHSLGRGAWKREGGALKRTFVGRSADVTTGDRGTAVEFSQRKAKFARATLWR